MSNTFTFRILCCNLKTTSMGPQCFILIVLISFIFLVNGEFVWMTTERGTIQFMETTPGSNSYYLEESQWGWDEYLEIQRWDIKSDPSFPNGVFIHSNYYPNLVWDLQGTATFID